MTLQKLLFFGAILACLSPYGSPPLALALGLMLAFTAGNPYPSVTRKPARYLLQISVVLLGFGMNISDVYSAGRGGFAFTVATIAGTLIIGYLLGRALSVNAKTSSLISAGTAICGGSAIAAIAPVIEADSDQISISLGTIFILNSIALFAFPPLGSLLGMSQTQFGVFTAIAIHDTSSVVGAAASYGPDALAVATTVKLVRALWIAPVALVFAFAYRQRRGQRAAKIAIPWFIFLFVGASLIRSGTPATIPPSIFDSLVNLAKAGMTVTLFLIGLSLSRGTLRAVGFTPLLQGAILWILITAAGLAAVINLV